MKSIQLTNTLLIMAFFSSPSLAGVYKCIDDQGKTAYQSKPCANEKNALKIDIKTGSTTDIASKLKQQEKDKQLKIEQEKQQQLQQTQEAERIKQATLESSINQQLIKDNPVQYTAFAIPPYKHDQLSNLVKPFASRLPEIEKFRRIASQKALATGECKRVESNQLSVRSQLNNLIITVDCSSAKTFQFTETELLN